MMNTTDANIATRVDEGMVLCSERNTHAACCATLSDFTPHIKSSEQQIQTEMTKQYQHSLSEVVGCSNMWLHARVLTRLCSSSTKLNMADAKKKVGAMFPTATSHKACEM